MCLNRFDADTKTAFLDLYTKVDVEATPAPVAPEATANADELSMVKDANTGNTTFRYKNETVVYSEQEIIELLDRGLSAEQIKMRVIATLEKVAANKSNAPF